MLEFLEFLSFNSNIQSSMKCWKKLYSNCVASSKIEDERDFYNLTFPLIARCKMSLEKNSKMSK